MCICHHRTPDYLVMILHPPPPLTVHQTPIPQMMTLQKPPQPLLTQTQELIPINPTNRTRMLPTLKRLLLQMISQHSQNRDPGSGECSSKPPLSLPTTPRPPVWLPGYGPPPQPHASWQPSRGRSKSRPRQRGNASPKEASVADLIDLN
jgi:hypothetical protein